jgi:hypothetical protein
LSALARVGGYESRALLILVICAGLPLAVQSPFVNPTSTKERSSRTRLIELIDRPLGFYVLSLLIVETFIGVVAALARSSVGDLHLGLWLGVGMFVYITGTVTFIVWHKAHVLTFDRDAHLRERRLAPLGTDKKQVNDPEKLPPPQRAPEAR